MTEYVHGYATPEQGTARRAGGALAAPPNPRRPAARIAAVLFWVWPPYLVWKSELAHGFYGSGLVLVVSSCCSSCVSPRDDLGPTRRSWASCSAWLVADAPDSADRRPRPVVALAAAGRLA